MYRTNVLRFAHILLSFGGFFLLTILSVADAFANDLSTMKRIGPVASFAQTPTGVTITCEDGSQVQISVLAPGIIRVRAAFAHSLPETDHSWAVPPATRPSVVWQVAEKDGRINLTSPEIEVSIQKIPLLIEFREASTHAVLNGDAIPMLFDSATGNIAAAKKLGIDEHFYGLGEKAAHLNKRRQAFTMWNTDNATYIEGSDPLYQSIPFYIGLQGSRAYGIFFDNSFRSSFDFGQGSQNYVSFSAESGELNYYFLNGPEIKKILREYGELTGFMPMPPIWSLGNQQSRYSYYPTEVAQAVVDRYRKDDLPLDVLFLDIDYMNQYRVFTWNTQRFPDPLALANSLKANGVKIVASIDPGVAFQPPVSNIPESSHPELDSQNESYYVFNQGTRGDYFLKRKSGEIYQGKVWPEKVVFPDFTMDSVRAWWGGLHRALIGNGVQGVWNDMNEPSDFSDGDGKNKSDVVSYDEGQYTTHSKNRNVYGLLMSRATYEGLSLLQPNGRPFVLTRSGFAGIQRYAAMWTGDNHSTWDALALSLPMFESLGLSGEPFVGADIGGFIDHGPAPFTSLEIYGRIDGELLTRWYQVGFLTPFCRNHKVNWGADQEPWQFGPYYESIIRKYLKLRYRLMPFLYTTFEEAHRTGVPVLRPLVLNYQEDPNVRTLDDEFMIGDALLVAPVLNAHQIDRSVYLPPGDWFDFWTRSSVAGGARILASAPLETVPMFVRAGSIIPTGPDMNYLKEHAFDPLTFDIYLDANGRAAGKYYEDDGLTQAYRNGDFRRTNVSVESSKSRIAITIESTEGRMPLGARFVRFRLAPGFSPANVNVDGNPCSKLDPDQLDSGWTAVSGEVIVTIKGDRGGKHAVDIFR